MLGKLQYFLALLCVLLVQRALGDADTSPNNCLCECDGETYPIYVPDGSTCSQESCSAMANCNTEGSHNDDTSVKATPIDCTCTCCKDEGCSDDVYVYFMTPNGKSSECSSDTCEARSECSGYPYATAVYASDSSSSSSSSGLSGGAIAGIVIGSIAGAALIGVAIYVAIPKHKKSVTSGSWIDVHDQMHSSQPPASTPSQVEAGMGDYLQ